MAHGIKNMSKGNPCPICGGPDWCGWLPDEKAGGWLVICQRHTTPMKCGIDGVLGVDGNYYIYVGQGKNGCSSIFEEAQQRLAKQRIKEGIKQGVDVSRYQSAVTQHQTLTVVDAVEKLPVDRLNVLYLALLDGLVLEDKHKQVLLREGWSEELIVKSNIKSFPEEDRIRYANKGKAGYATKNPWRKALAKKLVSRFGSLAGLPGAYQNRKGEWTFAGQPGMLLPVRDVNHNVYALHIRLDDTKASGGKYRNFSSYHVDEDAKKQGFLINRYHKGCQAGNTIGYYYDAQVDNMFCAFITEGSKKGIFSNHCLRQPFISVPGVNSYGKLIEGKIGERPIDILKKRGVEILIIAYDADKAVNEKVLYSEQKTIELMKQEQFQVGVAEWDASCGKGIDDLLQNGYRPSYVLK